MTTVEQDRAEARIDGLLNALRDAEADFRQSYSRVLGVVNQLDEEKAGAVAGFGTTARLLAGVLNLPKSEARTRVEHAALLTSRRSLTGELLPPSLPATAAELAAGAISPTHVRVIAAVMRRIPDGIHPETTAQAEQRPWRAPPAGSTRQRWAPSRSACWPTSTRMAPNPPRNPTRCGSCGSVPEPTGS